MMPRKVSLAVLRGSGEHDGTAAPGYAGIIRLTCSAGYLMEFKTDVGFLPQRRRHRQHHDRDSPRGGYLDDHLDSVDQTRLDRRHGMVSDSDFAAVSRRLSVLGVWLPTRLSAVAAQKETQEVVPPAAPATSAQQRETLRPRLGRHGPAGPTPRRLPRHDRQRGCLFSRRTVGL